MHHALAAAARKAIPVALVDTAGYKDWLKRQPARIANWLNAQGFKPAAGNFCIIPDQQGKLAKVIAGISSPASMWDIADLPRRLPAGTYRLEGQGNAAGEETLALGWMLGAYRYLRYKKADVAAVKLSLSPSVDQEKITAFAEAIALVRDLINTPAEDFGPAELADAIAETGKRHRAKVSTITGDDLLAENYPAIHTVGRASSRAPRLVDLIWGNEAHPRVTLVGKGVCFDTGGLDLKPSSGMYTMKKDMGGAACALGIASLIMSRKLPVRLRLLIPAVENSVSGNAFRPSDVIRMRSGMTVEVGNTDAEGRLVLADALAEAIKEKPALLIDFSTLTGAARTAVGTDITAFFANDDKLAEELAQAAKATEDPMWRLPLHAAYERMLDSPIADVNSAPSSPYAGAITAALFLQRFVAKNISWAHLDFMAWNPGSRPGRPEGGEAMALRAVYRVIEERYAKR